MSKFKVGDKALCIKNLLGQFTAGREYVVTLTYGTDSYRRIEIAKDDSGKRNGWMEHHFELVQPQATTLPPGTFPQNSPKYDIDSLHYIQFPAPTEIKTCSHSWKFYQGIVDQFHYCEKCDEKCRDLDTACPF
jgi:hypothetical protein